ncbi:transposase [Streptomyces sp. NPDC090021]|uniref:transposase n=1 Tax=Streptomyces sp. NPDC090021 TaxID=3365919 RepID=UPI0037FCF21C
MPGLRSWRRRTTSSMAAPRKYPDELRERAIREVRTTGRPIAHVAKDPGIHKEALRGWVRQPRPTAASGTTGSPLPSWTSSSNFAKRRGRRWACRGVRAGHGPGSPGRGAG